MTTKENTHRLTIFLDHAGFNTQITMTTSTPNVLQDQLCKAIDNYYRWRWLVFPKPYVLLPSDSPIVVPIQKILCFKIEKIGI